jgi:protein-L-isoaspartate(D-aspartate) O-methyltransferase
MDRERKEERVRMVSTQIRARGIRDPDILRAMEMVPRHIFVPDSLSAEAYLDHPLPIGHGQTISQPFIVAEMSELLAPVRGSDILEIGTGSGYQAAVLAEAGARVTSLERISKVADSARTNLHNAGYDGVTVIVSDGTRGWLDRAPYDGIIITAATPIIPSPLPGQLRDGGRLVCPVGPPHIQEMIRLTRTGTGFKEERFGAVRFVPLIGEFGWSEETYGHSSLSSF